MKSKILILAVSLGLFILNGCGGGGSSNSNTPIPKIGTGTYNDSAVQGVGYVCGKQRGTTDEKGTFSFEVGASCTFSMGDIILSVVNSQVLDDSNVTLLVEDIKVAQLLQSLDLDGDASNGITISPEVIEVVNANTDSGSKVSEISLDTLVAAIQVEVAKADENSILSTYKGEVVNEEAAQAHLDTTRQKLDKEAPTITLSSTAVTIEINTKFSYPTVVVKDDIDTDINATQSGDVNVSKSGAYTVTYSATDKSGKNSTTTFVVTVQDTKKPTIELKGESTLTLALGESYIESGVSISDNSREVIEATITGTVDTTKIGTYTLTYTATDTAQNMISITRTIKVVDTEKPVITLTGSSSINLLVNSTYIEEGVIITDNSGETLSAVITGTFDTNVVGNYILTYTVTDSSGNKAFIQRTINVTAGNAPTISITGSENMNFEIGATYNDEGAIAQDTEDGTLVVNSNLSTLNFTTLGIKTITYTAIDSSGNKATANRVVTVVDTTKPEITLLGEAIVELKAGTSYTDAGVSVSDNSAEVLTVVRTGVVDTTTIGTYTIKYNVKDSSDNEAMEVQRKVNILSVSSGNVGVLVVDKIFYVIDDEANITLPIAFNANGTGNIQEETFTYNTENEVLTLTFSNGVTSTLSEAQKLTDHIQFKDEDNDFARFYFTQEAAQQALNNKGLTISLSDLLGRSFYLVDENRSTQGCDIEVTTFNTDGTTGVFTEGNSSEQFTFVIDDDRLYIMDDDEYHILSERNSEYFLFKNYEENNNFTENTRAYFDEEKAKAYVQCEDNTSLRHLIEGKTFYVTNEDETAVETITVGTNGTGTYESSSFTYSIANEVLTIVFPDDSTLVLKNPEEMTTYLRFTENDTETGRFFFTREAAEATLTTLNHLIVGKTKYFVNELGGIGERTYNEDGTYTGSITLENGTTLNVSGTYTISDKVLTLNRISPSSATLVLTYIAQYGGRLDFDLSINEGDSIKTASFNTQGERDSFIAGIPLTQEILNNLVLYESYEENGIQTYAKLSFNTTTSTVDYKSVQNSQVEQDEQSSYTLLENGTMRIDPPNGDIMILLLRAYDSNHYVLYIEYNEDGEQNKETQIFYTIKPSTYPENL